LFEQVDLADDYYQAFDLTANIPPSVLRIATDAGQLILIPISKQGHLSPLEGVLSRIAQVLDTPGKFVCVAAFPNSHLLQYSGVNKRRKPLRICVNNLGGFDWGDCTPQARTTHLRQCHAKATIANNTIHYQFKDPDKV
jgi:hypothetical protein